MFIDPDAVVYKPAGFAPDPMMGRRFHHLTVIAPAADSKTGSKRYFLRCDCGSEIMLYESKMLGKQALKSCGCRGKGSKPVPWTEEQLATLRREYPLIAGRCADKVGRSPLQCRRKAGELGIFFTGKHQRKGWWTPEEDAILREHYPKGGTATVLPMLDVSRSKNAIQDRAYKLRISCPKELIHRSWTEEERAIVRKHYRKGGWKAVARYLPHRSEFSILNIANEMGVKVKRSWSRSEEKEFKKLYLEGGSALCKKRWPQRSVVAIRGKARTMKLRYSKFWWSPTEAQIVREHFPVGGWKAVNALLPHRGEGAIHGYCTKWKIKLNRWTEAEDAILREYYPDEGARGCEARLPQQTLGAIRNRVHVLGLSWKGKWSAEEMEIIARLYPDGGVKAVGIALPHRNYESIRSKANYMGIKLSAEAYSKSQRKLAKKVTKKRVREPAERLAA